MPKAGWTIEKTVTRYKAEYDLHGKKVAEGVTELSWSGGRVADDEYDEFVFRATFDASLPAGETIYFPVIQACGTDRAEWTEVPAEGQTAHDRAPGARSGTASWRTCGALKRLNPGNLGRRWLWRPEHHRRARRALRITATSMPSCTSAPATGGR